MNRGSRRIRRRFIIGFGRFNEAPIHESGKFKNGRLPDSSVPASMRPRFMNRGSAPCPVPTSYPLAGFNEAPIHESGK